MNSQDLTNEARREEHLFYKKRVVSKEAMEDLERNRTDLLQRIGALEDESQIIHPKNANKAVKTIREDLKMHLTDAGSPDEGRITFPSSIYEGNDFALENAYEDWHRVIGELVEKQQGTAKGLINQWFETLSKVRERDSDLEDSDTIRNSANENTGSANQNSFISWFAFLIVICGIQSLFFCSLDDLRECYGKPLQCMQNVVWKIYVEMLKWYAAFHNISIENMEEVSVPLENAD